MGGPMLENFRMLRQNLSVFSVHQVHRPVNFWCKWPALYTNTCKFILAYPEDQAVLLRDRRRFHVPLFLFWLVPYWCIKTNLVCNQGILKMKLNVYTDESKGKSIRWKLNFRNFPSLSCFQFIVSPAALLCLRTIWLFLWIVIRPERRRHLVSFVHNCGCLTAAEYSIFRPLEAYSITTFCIVL